MSSKAQPLASDPAASQRTTSPVSSCQERLKFSPSQACKHHWVSVSFCNQCGKTLSCASLLSWLWGPGEELIGMRSIPSVTSVFTRRMKIYLLAWLLVKQSPFSLCCVLILHFCSEVQDLWSTNEAVPQRKPPQKVALRQQRSHRERTPIYEEWLAGCAVSHCSVFLPAVLMVG